MKTPALNRNAPLPDLVPGDDPLESIGQRIRAARKALSLNQEALAIRLGVTQPTVANWEADVHNPRQLMLAKLAEALDVSLGWLAGGEMMDRGPQPAAGTGYLGRALYHVPVYPMGLLTSRERLNDPATLASAVDFIPLSGHEGSFFACFVSAGPYVTEFPGETLFVFNRDRHRIYPGCFALITGQEGPLLHYWSEDMPQGACPAAIGEVLGTLTLAVRVF